MAPARKNGLSNIPAKIMKLLLCVLLALPVVWSGFAKSKCVSVKERRREPGV